MAFWGGLAGDVAVDTGVVDDGVHAAEPVDLLGHVAGFTLTGEVADDDGRSVAGEVAQRGRPLVVTGVDDDLVAVGEQLGGGCSAQALGGAGDQGSGHDGVPSVR